VNKALLIVLIVVVLSQTAVVIYAMLAQKNLLEGLRVEVTELRIQVRAEFHRIQEILSQDQRDRDKVKKNIGQS
jgi:hypothetical protein